uniref:Uncharacterized protein n=1 Tax=Amazona collaria TaxID=241587 RepID=A0A8B9FKD7_9PSIT
MEKITLGAIERQLRKIVIIRCSQHGFTEEEVLAAPGIWGCLFDVLCCINLIIEFLHYFISFYSNVTQQTSRGVSFLLIQFSLSIMCMKALTAEYNQWQKRSPESKTTLANNCVHSVF